MTGPYFFVRFLGQRFVEPRLHTRPLRYLFSRREPLREIFFDRHRQLPVMAGKPEPLERTIHNLTRVRLTQLDKVLYPAAGITKQDVLMYYIRVAPFLLPFLHDRPVTMHRF